MSLFLQKTIDYHDEIFGGHCGQKKLYAKLKEQFY